MNNLQWIGPRKCETGACGRVAKLATGRVAIGSTSFPHNLAFMTSDEWEAFKQAVRDGDFDEVTA